MGKDVEAGRPKNEGTPLLSAHAKQPPSVYDHARPEDSKVWQSFHACFFLLGGVSFILGTSLYFVWGALGLTEEVGDFWAAVLYIVGSFGFLGVDSQEFLTFTKEDKWVRINIMCSWTGSLLYVVGSAGFLPDVFAATDGQVGIQGFIWGSFFIGCSQLWKTWRIGSEDDGFSTKTLFRSTDSSTAVGVELSAGIGAWCFFFGTMMFWHGPQEGPFYTLILSIWLVGSCFFTLGGCFLTWRHLNNM
mmetsp:Transcript_4736/g.11981  ORF Transcript_4736/g.11981 Transcript_4736/m.11981 type:complete len:246 (+) Transcript_4736:177-914(+)